MTREEMIEKFLCPGCVAGSDTKCGHYKAEDDGCAGHVMGTTVFPAGITFALGMPKGFNRGGWCGLNRRNHSTMTIRLYPEGDRARPYDKFNIPVWSLEQDGHLFVRVAQPRLGNWAVDVYEGGKRDALCPSAVDVGPIYEEYD